MASLLTKTSVIQQGVAWAWFNRHLGEYYDECNELMATQMVEAFCFHHDTHEWLDEDTHWIWDMPINAEKKANAIAQVQRG